ncbi:MAG: N-acetylmuramoyl-L-alanine amidase [Oscillospiraceae bacterium]|nr:N-acetylmuramoyl-L-alanine amidase [Oscillospiraceae bacterium]
MKAIIGLDAGHGGSSSGTYSCNTTKDGLFEKDFALELVLDIEEKLLANGFGAVLTRRTDVNPGTVVERARKMIEGGADFALSVHFNGFGTQSANGTEVFVPYKETAAGIEARLQGVLTKYFRQRKPFARSNNYYNRNETFDKKLNLDTRKFDAVADKSDYFGFIRTCWQSHVSADLLEICFLTNPADFKAYTENRGAIADGIARSIVEAFGEEYVSVCSSEHTAKPRIQKKGNSKSPFLNVRE